MGGHMEASDISSSKRVINVFHSHLKDLLVMTAFSFALYSVMIVNELTNTFDGMWKGESYLAGTWEFSIGRWLWPYIDHLRTGISCEPFLSIFALFILNLGNLLFLEILQVRKSFTRIAVWLLLIGNTCVSVYLSYRYMVLTFAFSYFFSILGAYFLAKAAHDANISKRSRRGRIRAGIPGVLFITLSLGLYQANLGCTLLTLCFLWIDALTDKEQNSASSDKVQFLPHCIFELLAVGLSCIFYKIIWDLHDSLLHVKNASYNGAQNTSLRSMFTALPQSFKKSYLFVYHYFAPGQLNNIYQDNWLLFAIVGILFIACIFRILTSNTILWQRILGVLFLLLVPPFANVCIFLAPDTKTMMLQMTMPMAMILPGLLSIMPQGKSSSHSFRIRQFPKYILSLGIVVCIFGNVMMVSADQHEMLQSRNTSISLMNRIFSEKEIQNVISDSDAKIIFAGIPADNSLFLKDDLWNTTNSYAHYGNFWTKGNCVTQSYTGFLRDCGIDINLLSDDVKYHKIIASSEVRSMPSYPEKGYIRKVDGYYVIRLS